MRRVQRTRLLNSPPYARHRTQSKRNTTITVMSHCAKGSARNLSARFLTLVPPPLFVRIR